MKENLFSMRKEYASAPLHVEDLDSNPFVQFKQWLEEAKPLLESNAMTLATVDAQGKPTLRTVLLKYFDAEGFVFFSNYTSKKAQDLAHNPSAAVHFAWLEQERQVEICGHVEKISRAESLRYFLTRPLGSQLGAWVSSQSTIISSRSLLETKFAELKSKFAKGEVPLPDFWGGYKLFPTSFEFWQGGGDRLHDRFEYTRHESDWHLVRLAP